MTREEAIATIEGLQFRPGWSFHAEKPPYWAGDLYPHSVRIFAKVKTYDTSYRDPAGVLTSPVTITPGIVIDVRDLDQAGLVYAILTQLIQPFNEHEDREFLQVNRSGAWYAPLHPHTDAGEYAWYSRGAGRLAA